MSMSNVRHLGTTGIDVSAIGIGVWSWGDRRAWGYGKSYGRVDVKAAFDAALANGVTFFDSAELYGGGSSELLLGSFVRESGAQVVLASKFAPYPWRISARTFERALDSTLERLNLATVDLYQIHWPYSLLSINTLMDAMAAAVRAGKVRAVGVSNYSAGQMRAAAARLAGYGIPLASNQVEYSLLKRDVERNGVLEACRDLDVALIAYSPLAQGLLTGKYADPNAPVAGYRRWQRRFSRRSRQRMRPLVDLQQSIGEDHGKTSAQVALNWLLCRDDHVIPIPGAKTADQATGNAGAMGWRLSEEECAHLDRAAARYR